MWKEDMLILPMWWKCYLGWCCYTLGLVWACGFYLLGCILVGCLNTPRKNNSWTTIMEVWKIIFLSKWVICSSMLIFQGVYHGFCMFFQEMWRTHSVPMSPRRGFPLMSFVCAVMFTASPSSWSKNGANMWMYVNVIYTTQWAGEYLRFPFWIASPRQTLFSSHQGKCKRRNHTLKP